MFDLNGDNSVEFSEFEKVCLHSSKLSTQLILLSVFVIVQRDCCCVQMQQIALKQCSIGIKHRDHSTTGSMLKAEQSAITTYFFGKDLDKSMTVERFRDFQEQLNKEILYLEVAESFISCRVVFRRDFCFSNNANTSGMCVQFNRYDPVDGKITEKNFASSLLAFAGFKDTRGKKMMKRIKKAYTDEESQVLYALHQCNSSKWFVYYLTLIRLECLLTGGCTLPGDNVSRIHGFLSSYAFYKRH